MTTLDQLAKWKEADLYRASKGFPLPPQSSWDAELSAAWTKELKDVQSRTPQECLARLHELSRLRK